MGVVGRVCWSGLFGEAVGRGGRAAAPNPPGPLVSAARGRPCQPLRRASFQICRPPRRLKSRTAENRLHRTARRCTCASMQLFLNHGRAGNVQSFCFQWIMEICCKNQRLIESMDIMFSYPPAAAPCARARSRAWRDSAHLAGGAVLRGVPRRAAIGEGSEWSGSWRSESVAGAGVARRGLALGRNFICRRAHRGPAPPA